ncbi:Tripartite ATP-independent periplasmic transporter, DctQ component [Labrenzia sp. THAF35]|jgi:TRAP-type mannitol/chloroaromatic compound transport system permease small subunit|uniref:TRAP transporter small permease subunit n=1 Tax=Labrenzia sp. THAF35 TaxID=2587854 RepID=UPI0012A97D05|nr:TRAP transporter small permease subunit [Labrenzia sp. THAF35]MEC9417116.1 TRAP transporter small permease subunit [Pseudomonadota bacterium]QFT67925.1 Tripartite ATP-independent periplasmic transporter, DctQ component [Labrenzia sp. THAF35]
MFKKLFQLIEDLNIAIGKCVSFLIWAGIAVLCFEVVARYGFSQPTTWAHGYTQRIFGSYFVLVGAYTLIKREHVRVDILLLPGRVRWNAFLDLINLAFLLLWGAVLTYEGWNFFYDSWAFNELDDSVLGHPMWPPKLALFAGSFLITVQAVIEAVKAALRLIAPHIVTESTTNNVA